MVYSASITLSDGNKYANYSSGHFLIRHILSIGIAVIAALFAYRIPTKVWEKIAPLIFGISVALLILVLIPGIGKSVNFARRWIPLGIMNELLVVLRLALVSMKKANFPVLLKGYKGKEVKLTSSFN
jgi:cell division protein FtsW